MKNKKLFCTLKICIAVMLTPAVFFAALYVSMLVSGFLQINRNSFLSFIYNYKTLRLHLYCLIYSSP